MGEFVRVSLICLALATPLLVIVERAPDVPSVTASLVGLWLIMAVMWIAAIRRLHDNDDGAASVFWTMGGPTLLLLGITLWSTGVVLPIWLLLVGYLVGGALTVIGHLGIMQAAGTAGPNRFGPDTQKYRPRSPSQDIGERAEAWPLWDPRGRTSRSGFIVRLAFCAALAAPLVLMTRSALATPVWGLAMGAVAFTLSAVLLLVSSARRTHDLDDARGSGGGSFGLLVGLGPLFCAPAIWFPGFALAPALAVGAILSCGLLFSALMPGHYGPNRHGPDTVRNRPAPRVRTAHSEDFLKIRRKMKRLALPALSFTEADKAGFSKLGGDPEMPEELPWPLGERGPLSFLAQIDLVQAHINGGPTWLPQTGALYLFVEAHGGGGDGRAAVVLHAPDISAARTALPPSGLPKFGARFSERRFGLQSFTAYPTLDGLGVDVREIDVEDDELDELSDLPASMAPDERMHWLGGHPSEIQQARMTLECELGSRGLDTSGLFEDDLDPKLLRAAKSWRLLFQIDSDPELGMMWDDAGMLYVFVREADARAGDFSKTWLISQTH